MAAERLWIVGPGRLGLSLGALLHRSGSVESIVYTGRSATAPAHALFGERGPAIYSTGWDLPDPPPAGVVVSVPDGEIEGVAARLASIPVPPSVPVVHTSGARGSEALAPLAKVGVSVGSVHPLAAVAGAETGPERLRGAWFAVEGDPDAVRLAGWITSAAGGRVLAVHQGGKPLYHAAAVIASNYLVTLLDFAERVAIRAGLEPEQAREALAGLALGAVSNVHPAGPAAALTGPIARGDAETVARHLSELSGPDRALYSVLARETLALARRAGLSDAAGSELESLLGGEGE
jgi:predicted short-subunit dehydrogenase-like oxidoreductase (DUF2520 family)